MHDLIRNAHYILGMFSAIVGALWAVFKLSQRLPKENEAKLKELHRNEIRLALLEERQLRLEADALETKKLLKSMQSDIHKIANGVAGMEALLRAQNGKK